MLRIIFGLLAAAMVTATSSALAQDDFGAEEAGPDQSPNDTAPTPADAAATEAGAGTSLIGDEQAVVSEQMGTEERRDSTDPFEEPHQGYYFAGLFYRHIFLPEFLLNLFLDESEAASNPAFGAEVTYRKDNFDIIGSLWYASYAVEGPFRASGDPETDTEIIDSELGVLFLSASFLWSTPFNDVFALEYGVGLGLGLVLGDLHRTEAYPDSNGDWQACEGPSNPGPGAPAGLDGRYCDPTMARDGEEGGHFNEKARKWSDGGDVPNVVPWLAVPQIALRIKPIRQLMIRVEGGFGLGFFLGGSVSYGF